MKGLGRWTGIGMKTRKGKRKESERRTGIGIGKKDGNRD